MPKHVAAFCSQDCFKAGWSDHKELHKPTANAYMFVLQNGRARSVHMPPWNWTGELRPHRVAPQRSVPDDIEKPDWAVTGYPAEEIASRQQSIVPVRSTDAIAKLRAACELGRDILDVAHRLVKPGVTTDEIDRVVHDYTIEHNAYPSPLRYHNFPKSVCTSVNEVVCHGIPDMRELQDGDIVNVDVSCLLDGAHGDLNETFAVGTIDNASRKLTKVTYECLMKAIQAVKPGMRYREVGDIISTHATRNNFSVVRTYCGHGIGDLFHCAPNVPHYARNKAKGTMQVGHTFTIEPMINEGVHQDVMWPDGWTSVTADGKRSAQFEHTLEVTETGCNILTARKADSPPLWWEKEGVSLEI